MSSEARSDTRSTAPALLLAAFVAVATTLLMVGDFATRDSILLRQREDLLASLSQVVPSDRYDASLLDETLAVAGPDGSETIVYRAIRGGHVTAVAFPTSGAGYAGAIDLLMGVDAQGEVLGVRVISHTETPGLGDRIEVEKDDWILGFSGRSLSNPSKERWAVRKDGGEFDQFTGATITPRAVVGAVKEGLEFFAERHVELTRPKPEDAEPAPTPEAVVARAEGH